MTTVGNEDSQSACVCTEGSLCRGNDCLQVSTESGFNLKYILDNSDAIEAKCVEYAELNKYERFTADYHFLAGAKGHAVEHGVSDSDVVNIVIIASDAKHGKMAVATMNSILAVRDSAIIHFFIFVSEEMMQSTSNPLHAYKVAVHNRCTQVFLHSVDKPLKAAQQLQAETHYVNGHYGGIYALLKLVVHDFLPTHVTSFILVDSDMVFLGNVGRMRQLARHGLSRRPGAVITMGCTYDPSRVNHYCTELNQPKNCHPTHFCISAPFYADLEKMRAMNWTNHVVRKAMENMHSDYPTANYSTADQDVFNRILANNAALMSPLPCRWRCEFSTYGKDFQDHKLPSDNRCFHEKCLVYHFNVASNTKEHNWHFSMWEEYSNMPPAMVNDPTICPL